MDWRVSPAYSIGVAMTSGAGAGGVIDFVAGSAVLYIGPRRPAVVGTPANRRVGQRHPVFVFMTIVAELSAVMAPPAVHLFPLGLKSVSEPVVQVVNISRLIVTAVAVQTIDFLLMTGLTPIRFERGLFGVPMRPAKRVYLRQRSLVGMTKGTVAVSTKIVVA